ncbi:MAG: hypothetical protein MUP13_04910, partial [Thermoanaerobaculales bacterium]|nr:hypothetical protein [Thermoanaerobaculales bacterium]
MPAETYPVDEWRIVERGLTPDIAGRLETIFALSNGFLGVRGAHDDGEPVYAPGTFINGFYESWPIRYPETAFGFATSGQTIVNVPDATTVRVAVDGRVLTPAADGATVERVLDMRTGILTREATWDLDAVRVRVRSRRLVSMRYRHLVAISWDVTVDGAPAKVRVSSELHNHQDAVAATALPESDPRKANVFGDRVLLPIAHETDQMRIVMAYSTRSSDLGLACGIDHHVDTTNPYDVSHHIEDDVSRVEFSVDAEPGAVFRLTRIVGYHTATTGDAAKLTELVHQTLDRGRALGFDSLAASQQEYLDDAWAAADIRVIGRPRLQQAIRWNLFQLIQATARVEGTGVPAKGLTSQAYDGHYFWDMDMFFTPFLTYTHPEAALELLRYRYSTLGAARRRAAEMSQVGALFPWRTINGEEASAYFPAGTAQYHINAAVMYAVKRYVDTTGDRRFLMDMGVELVLDTARLWLDLGFFDEEGAFHIHGVTGPDEYTALVNDNTYTNLMAQMHLRYAADVVDWLAANHPDRHTELAATVALGDDEVRRWRTAADRMTILYDEERGINPQDSEFLAKEVWDFEATKAEDYPLLLHHHPLVLYRHQVLKQPDVVLAMLARGDAFT